MEVNSDKYTVLGVLFILLLGVFGLASNLYALMTHWAVTPRSVGITDWMSAILCVGWVAVLGRESKIRKAYPYGVAGACLLIFSLPVDLIWPAASVEVGHPLRLITLSVRIVGWGLVLFEGARWFRARTTLAERRAE